MQKKRIIIIGAGVLQIPAIKIAQEMEIYTVVFDYNKEAPGMKIADYPVVVSTRDIEGCVRMAKQIGKEMKIDGVITVGTDASTTVASVAAALDIPGNKFEDAYAASNKIRMRERFKKHGIPQPDFYPVWSYDEALNGFRKLSHPVVIKPADNMGARGVMKIEKEEDLLNGFNRAKSASPSGEIIIEEYMDGPELSIDMLIYNGEIYVTGVADRVIEYPPFFVETGHIMPSVLPKEHINDAVNVMKNGIRALGLKIGAAKGDIKVTKDGAKVGEIAARLSGGFMSAYTYPFASGVNLIKNALEIAIGNPPSDLEPKWNKVSVEKAFIPGSGIVEDIEGLENAYKIKGVKEIFMQTKVGDILTSPTNNLEKAGNVITVADTRDEAIAIANKVIDTVKIKLTTHKAVTLEEIRRIARERFNGTCKACAECDGYACKGEVHGVGSSGLGETFMRNISSLRKYVFNTYLIREEIKPNIESVFFSTHLEAPLAIAPMSDIETQLGGIVNNREYFKCVVDAASNAGILGILGDNGTEEHFYTAIKAISSSNTANAAIILKPLRSQELLIKRLREAESAGAKAVGIDIDFEMTKSSHFSNTELSLKTEKEISALVKSVKVPFIVKGILSVSDAMLAAKAGVNVIYVSNKGGRTLKSVAATADVLPLISKEIRSKYKHNIKIISDGGYRDGTDILKGYALGADIISIGRPFLTALFGKGSKGVEYQSELFFDEMKKGMHAVGAKTIADICYNQMSIIASDARLF